MKHRNALLVVGTYLVWLTHRPWHFFYNTTRRSKRAEHKGKDLSKIGNCVERWNVLLSLLKKSWGNNYSIVHRTWFQIDDGQQAGFQNSFEWFGRLLFRLAFTYVHKGMLHFRDSSKSRTKPGNIGAQAATHLQPVNNDSSRPQRGLC